MDMDINHIKQTLLKQKEAEDSPVVILSLLRYFNDTEDMSVIKKLSGVSSAGLTFEGIMNAFEYKGYECKAYQASIDDLIKYNKPMILQTINPMTLQNHFSIFYGIQGANFIIGNITTGFLDEIDRKHLCEIWLSGFCLSVSRNT